MISSTVLRYNKCSPECYRKVGFGIAFYMMNHEVYTVKIGIIGPKSSCESIARDLHYIDPSVEVRCYVREQVSACAEVYPDCERECDAVLFTGRAVESYVKSNCKIAKPTASVARSAVAVARAFLSMQKQNLNFDSLSIDIVEPQVIEDVLDAFQILAKNIYSYPTPEDIEEEHYVRWHKGLQDEGYTAVALTSLKWVFQQLLEDGYQAIYMGPTRNTTRLALERLKADFAINRAEQAQIAAEVLQLRNTQILEENYYSGMIEQADIYKSIIRYSKELQAAVFQESRWEYIIYANAGILLERRSLRLLTELQKQVRSKGLSLSSGIGIGVTAYQADINARKALRCALNKANPEDLYCIDENNELRGPLFRENELRYQLISNDPKVAELAEKTGLSPASILKLRAIIDMRHSDVFDAHDVADCLEATTRSARRIMSRLIEAGCGEVYSKENSSNRGRPKSLVRIHLGNSPDIANPTVS